MRLNKYTPEVPVWWPLFAVASVAWSVAAWAFGWPMMAPSMTVVSVFSYGSGALHAWNKAREAGRDLLRTDDCFCDAIEAGATCDYCRARICLGIQS